MGCTRLKDGRVFTVVCAVVLFAGGAAAETIPDSPPPPLVAWEPGRLVVRNDTALPAVRVIAELISQERFGEALARIEGMHRPDVVAVQAELALAVAGHPSFSSPDAVLETAALRLDKALAEAPTDLALLRLLHQLDTYRLASCLDLSALGRVRHALDCVKQGQLQTALSELTPFESDARQALLQRWALCAFAESTDDSAALREETIRSLRNAPKRKSEEAILTRLSALLERSSEYTWASTGIRPDDLLFPQWQMRCVRALYWGMADADEYRPSMRRALDEALAQLRRLFPDLPLVRSYAGEGVPWGGGLELSPAPADAPRWAVAMRELRARNDYLAEWWFQERQRPDGALSGDWKSDCRAVRTWLIPAVCCGNPVVESGATRVFDGAWAAMLDDANGGQSLKGDEGAARVQLDSAIMPFLFYGDPVYLERLMAHARMIHEEYTSVNAQGHRHFTRLPPGLVENPPEGLAAGGTDFLIAGEAMGPAAALAWYSGLPDCLALLHDWSLAWSEDGARLGVHKPGGVLPACVRVDDDCVDGPDGHWWDPGQGEAFEWRAERQVHVFGNALAAWSLTGDAHVLDGLRGELDLLTRYLGADAGKTTPGQSRGIGSAHWAARQIADSAGLLYGPYRAATGDGRYDNLEWVLLPSYARFLVSGDPRDVHDSLVADLAPLQNDLPLLTTEAPSAGRVPIRAQSLLGPLTGSPAPLSSPPLWGVTWRDTGVNFTALVRRCDSRGLSAWVYSFAEVDLQPQARFWRLEPGRYKLTLGPDADGDGVMDGPAGPGTPFEFAERSDGAGFTLPPRALHLLEVARIERDSERGLSATGDRPRSQPDVAVTSRDFFLGDTPRVGTPCRANVIVHNIGAADAQDLTVEMMALPADSEGSGVTVGKVRYGVLPCPADLMPKRALIAFEWRPTAPGRHRLQISVSCSNEEGEVWSGNNRCERDVDVAD